ncbi:hypothetical protein FRC10_004050 [Ceratobasidium sp. 414]|nr:hypothetical protein FRC10_004050 [Ceratobasidium sp. 414]
MFQLQCGESCNGVIDAWKLSCTPPVKQHHHAICKPARHHLASKLSLIVQIILARVLADCQASSETYLQSVAYCLKTHCFAEPWHEVEHYWSWLQADRDSRWPALLDVMPATKPPLAPVGMKILNQTTRVRDEVYDFDYVTAQAFAWNECWHQRMSYILVFSILGVLKLGALRKLSRFMLRRPYRANSILSSKFLTMVQKNLILPALSNSAQNAPILRGLGYLPSRIMVLFLVFFVGATSVANSIPYKSVQLNNWAINRRQEMMGFVANQAGLISFALIPLTILLSARNNPLLWLTGWSTATMITLHRWVGINAPIHPSMNVCFPSGGSQRRMDGAMVLEHGRLDSIQSYEIFLVLHVFLASFTIVVCYYHMTFRFNWRYSYLNWIYVAVGIWLADRSLRFILIWMNGLQGSIGQTSGSATAELVPNSVQIIIRLTVFPRLESHLIKPGTYYFAYFPTLQPRRPWENHPFLVATWVVPQAQTTSDSSDRGSVSKGSDTKKGEAAAQPAIRPCVTMLVKPYSGATQTLLDHLLTFDGATNIPISLEGPYGEPHPLHLYENVILVAGGIGITPALSYTRDLSIRGRHITLVWASRNAGLIKSLRSVLPENIKARIYYTGTGGDDADAPGLRPDLRKLVRDEVRMDWAVCVAFFVCGPAGMVDQVRTACIDCLGDDVPADKIGFYEESFSW